MHCYRVPTNTMLPTDTGLCLCYLTHQMLQSIAFCISIVKRYIATFISGIMHIFWTRQKCSARRRRIINCHEIRKAFANWIELGSFAVLDSHSVFGRVRQELHWSNELNNKLTLNVILQQDRGHIQAIIVKLKPHITFPKKYGLGYHLLTLTVFVESLYLSYVDCKAVPLH